MCQATAVEDGEDELSNLLCQLYRLHELVEKTLDQIGLRAELVATPERRAARGRAFDTVDAML